MVRGVWMALVLVGALGACDEEGAEKAQGAADASDGAMQGSNVDSGSMTAAEADVRGPTCAPDAPACAVGEKCTSARLRIEDGWLEPRCTKDPAEMGLGERDACFSNPGVYDLCSAGLTCTNFGSGEGFCIRDCSVPGTECAADQVCAPVDLKYGLRLCLPSCTRTEDCEFAGIFECVTRDGLSYCDVTMDR